MGEFQTLAQRKAQAVREMAEAHTQLQVELERYAHVHGGRFFLYGSVARGDYRFDSDIDILVDFPEPIESEAWQFAEEACLKRALKPDVRPLRYCGPNLLEHIRPHMKTIQ